MKNVNINLYTFEELNDAARAKAIEDCRAYMLDTADENDNAYSVENIVNDDAPVIGYIKASGLLFTRGGTHVNVH